MSAGHDMTCGTCGRTWNSDETPTPAARCPYEYDHVEMNGNVLVDRQESRFGEHRDADGFKVQVVTLIIRNASDTRGWYWQDVLDEPEVEMVGWVGLD